MSDFLDILKARARGDWTAVNEASLGRVYKHYEKASEGKQSFTILTAYRGARTPAENRAQQKKLEGDLRGLGLGFSKLKGHWQECQDPNINYGDCPKALLKDTAEPSLFVVGLARKDAERLQKKYEQDAIVYAGPDTEGKVVLIYNDGTQKEIGEFSPHQVAQAYSRVKGVAFAFEYVAQSYAEALIESKFLSDGGLRAQVAALKGLVRGN